MLNGLTIMNDHNDEDEDMAIAQAAAAIQRSNPYYPRRSFSTRRESIAVTDECDDGAIDHNEIAAISQFAAAFPAISSQSRGCVRRSSLRRASGGKGIDTQPVSRKRRSQNSSDYFADVQYSDEENDEKYSSTAQSTAETEDEYSARSVVSATDTEERPRKRLSHSSATSSKNSIGPLDPDRPRLGHRRRAAFRVPNFEAEAADARAKRLQLLKKDRNETRRTKANDGRYRARRSMSHTTGLTMAGSIISSSMPEEAEHEEGADLMRLSRSRIDRRVLSLPDPNAISRLSQTSLNEDVDFSDEHNGQSALSASLVATAEAARQSIGRYSALSYARRCSVMPSIGDHLEDKGFDEDDIEQKLMPEYDESEPVGSSFNVPPSIVCHSEVYSQPSHMSVSKNIDNSDSQSMACESSTFQRRPGRRMAMHRDMESAMEASGSFTHGALDLTHSHDRMNIDEMMMQGKYKLPHQPTANQTQNLLFNSQLHSSNPHQGYQGFTGYPENFSGGGSASFYSSERHQSSSSLNDTTSGLSSLLQGLQTTSNDQRTDNEVFSPNLFPGQVPGPTHNEAMLLHEPIVAVAAAVTENALAIQSLNKTAETLLAHASTKMMHPEDMSRKAPMSNEPNGLRTLFNDQKQQAFTEYISSPDPIEDENSSVYDSFDGKKTSVSAVELNTPQEEHAIRIIQKAIELDNPQIKTFIQNFKRCTRLILNDNNNSNDVALHLAVRRGSLIALEAILNADEDSCLIRNSAGHVPLHVAAECGNFAAVTSICKRSPASARVQCVEGCLPLHEAVSSGADKQDAPQITAMIISTFPEAVSVTTDEGLLPIHLAAMSGFSAGLRTIFAYEFETMYSRESTEMMLPLDFAVDGLNSKKGDAPDAELLSVAHQQPLTSQDADLNNFEACIEILLTSTLYNRPVLSPRDESSSEVPFLPLHGALAARPLQRTWNCLVSLYGKDHFTDVDEYGRNIAHYFCSKISIEDDDERSLSILEEIHQTEPNLFAQTDNCGLLPLHLCLLKKHPLSFELVKAVVKYHPLAVTVEVQRKSLRGFLPFQIAAINDCGEDVIMHLLRNHPIGVQSTTYYDLNH